MREAVLAMLWAACLTAPSSAGHAVLFTDKEEWLAAVDKITTIGFSDYPHGTVVTDQYVDLGLIVSGASDAVILGPSPEAFPQDGFGLNMMPHPMFFTFTEDQYVVGVDYPGEIWLVLYKDGKPFYGTGLINPAGIHGFAGVVSTVPFDMVEAFRIANELVVVDDLHFGGQPPFVQGDINLDGTVDIEDLVEVISAWGSCPGGEEPCPADLTGDGSVDVEDLVEVIVNWG